jgi:hypothetical protein
MAFFRRNKKMVRQNGTLKGEFKTLPFLGIMIKK